MESDPNTIYHIARDGEALGEWTLEYLPQGLRTGQVLASDLAWCEGMTDWRAIETIPELSVLLAGAVSATASAPRMIVPESVDGHRVRQRTTPASPLPASRYARLGGAIIDGLIILVMIFGALLLTDGEAIFDEETAVGNRAYVGFAAAMLLYHLLQGYLVAKRSQSVGKIVAKTRIHLEETGEPAGLMKGFIMRSIVAAVPSYIPTVGDFYGLIDTLMIFRSDRRCLHDHIAGTVVLVAE